MRGAVRSSGCARRSERRSVRRALSCPETPPTSKLDSWLFQRRESWLFPDDNDASMAAQVAPLEVDESVASLIVAHLPDIRDRLALACVSKVWRSAAGSPGCWGLYHDSLVVEGAVAERLSNELFAPNLKQLIVYAGDELRVLEIHSSALCGLPIVRYVVPLPRIQPLCFSFLQVLDLRGCKALSVITDVSYFLAGADIHMRPKENRLDRLMLSGCKLDGLDEAVSSLVSLWTYVRHEPNVEKSLQAPFDLCQCTGCDCIIGEGSQCKGCKHPYCSHCVEDDEVVWKLCDYCNKDIMCLQGECLGGQPYMSCSICDLQFCKACSWRPGCLVCSGSETRKGCLDAICEDCEQRHMYFVFCDACQSNWCNRCGTAPEISYCSTCDSTLCDDCNKGGSKECCACDECFCVKCSTHCIKCGDLYCEACDIRWHKCTFGTNDWESDETSSGDLHHLGETITPSSTGGTSGYTGSPSTASIVSTVPTPPCT